MMAAMQCASFTAVTQRASADAPCSEGEIPGQGRGHRVGCALNNVHAQGFQINTTPAAQRHILLWFRTKCLPYIMEGQGRYVNGHRFCHHVATALGKAGADVDVSCTDRQLGGHPLPFR